MRWGGRVAAAIEVLREILERHRPASEALKDWGKAHRFAGSGDRHAIGTLVYDVLRKRNSLGHRMGSDAPRALVLAALAVVWRRTIEDIAAWAIEPHGPGAVSEPERAALSAPAVSAPPWIEGDYPEWLHPAFVRAFGDEAALEGAALAERAPIDLRANTLRASREQVIAALDKFGAVEGPLSPWCVRIPPSGPERRAPNVEAEPAHGLGWFEVQDAGSQMAALLSDAKPGETIADICAGAGGKTLALAAMMEARGRLLAHDADRHRLRPIFERLARSGATNVEVIPAGDAIPGVFDCVLIDAPCSGSGAWRRRPDAKWRLKPQQLQQRLADQRHLLDQALTLARPGGRIVYITCSVLPEENADQIESFLARHPGLALASPNPLLLTPRRHDCDGFYIATLRKHG